MVHVYYLRLYSNIETVSCCLLLRTTSNGHGLKLLKIGRTVSSFNAMTAKISKKYSDQYSLIKFVWCLPRNAT